MPTGLETRVLHSRLRARHHLPGSKALLSVSPHLVAIDVEASRDL